MNLLFLAAAVCCWQILPAVVQGIMNPYQHSENYQQLVQAAGEDVRPHAWIAGVQCIDNFRHLYFVKEEKLTRSRNLLMTSLLNMSSPAAEIQQRFIKLMNELVSLDGAKGSVYQLRVISDAAKLPAKPIHGNSLLYVDFYLLVVDSIRRMRRIMASHVSKSLSWNPGAHFLVLFNNAEHRHDAIGKASEIFYEFLDKYYVQRVVVMYATDNLNYDILGMDYYSETECRTMHVHDIGTCSNGSLRTAMDHSSIGESVVDYFHGINLNNCTFNMCCSISAPFVEKDCITGIELRIVNFIRNRLKFEINSTCVMESRGIQIDDGNWTGLLGELVDRDCDFILGGFYPDNDVASAFWTSDCYLMDAHTFYVKIADPRPAWLALYSIFRWDTWLCILGMLVITWFFWWLFVNAQPEPVNHKEPGLAWINTLAVSICVSVNERPHYGASRMFFFWLAIYGVNLTSTYTSNLIVVLADPGKLHQIDDLHEVVEAGIPFGGYAESRDWFENDDDMWIFNAYNETEGFEPHTVNLEAVKVGERVILSGRMYILQNRLADEIYAFPSNVFSSPLQMIMKPGFPFLNDFNHMVSSMSDVGIMEKIDRDFRFNHTYLNRIAKMRPIFNEPAIVLTIEHMEGPFGILIVGVSGAVLVLIGEFIVFYLISPGAVRHKIRRKLRRYRRAKADNASPKSKRKFTWRAMRQTLLFSHIRKDLKTIRQGTAVLKKRIKRTPLFGTLMTLKKNFHVPGQKRAKLSKTKSKSVLNLKKVWEIIPKPTADEPPIYPVSFAREVRFTPLKRRRIVIKAAE